jgi:polyhydroxyalkanoate synthesis regulator phasin
MKVMANRRNVKLAVGGAAVAVVLVGLGAAGAIAASGVLSANEESRAVIEDAAQQLGVEPDALTDALKQGLKNRVDEALEAGRITEEQATALKERIDFGHFGQFASLGAAADYLGLTEAELREQLRDKTLAEIAKDEGKTVAGLVQALVSSAQKAIDEAVAAGRLTEEQATELKTNLDDRIEAFVNGEFRHRGFGFHHRFRSGDASPRAPPFFSGSHT